MSSNALAPVVEPSRIYPGKVDIIVKHSLKTSNRLSVSREDLAEIERQIAALLRP